ncbi:MAG TPA: HepT-like ribonuclease domain-containing protein [Hanamia sp.]|nr:HepT-like ribonuclease domain-containing protein [Hanamia sp.]
MPLKNTLQYLDDIFKQADEAARHLNISFERCSGFIDSKEYTEEQLIELEALTARFARLSDLLIQKIFKTIDKLDANSPGTVRDRIMQAEKKGLIEDADTLMEIRNVRNTIAHEYESIDLKEMFLFIFRHSSLLIGVLDNSKTYSTRFF